MADAPLDLGGPALLAHLRSHAGLSIRELARRAEASVGMISQVEGGERRPSRKLLVRLTAALDLRSAEEDQLLVAFGFTPDKGTPEQIAAFLRADKHLTPYQAEKLAWLIRTTYEAMRRETESASQAT